MTAFEFRIEADASKVRFLRADIREQLEAIGVAEGDVDRLVLVVDEIVSNAIEHGMSFRGDGDVLAVHLNVEAAHVALEFHDPGVPAATVAEILELLQRCRANGLPPLESERGRGLFLIDDGLDDLSVVGGENGIGLSLRGRILRETA